MSIWRSLIIIALHLLFVNVVYSQNSELDSLEKVLKKTIPDTSKVKVLSRLGYDFFNKDIDKSIAYGKKLLSLSKKIGDKEHKAKAYDILSRCYIVESYGLDTIIQICDRGIEAAQAADMTAMIIGLTYAKGIAYEKKGFLEKALRCYQKSFELSKKEDEIRRVITSLYGMSSVMSLMENQALAKVYMMQALQYAEEFGDERLIIYMKSGLGDQYYTEQNYDSTIIIMKSLLEYCERNNDKYVKAVSLVNIGKSYLKKNQIELSFDYLTKGYEVALELKNDNAITLALMHLSDNYFRQKNYRAAIKTAKEGLNTLGSEGDIHRKKAFYEELRNSYKSVGQFDSAFQYQQLFYELQDSIFNIDKEKQINTLTIKYEVAQKEAENKLLKATQATIIRNRNYIALGLMMAFLLALGWGITFYRANQQKKKHNEELSATVEERTKELKMANKHLGIANHNLEQANYELRTFNYIASHDIKEPIRNIGSYAGLIFRKLPSDLKESLGDYFDTIKRSTNQLYTLVEDFAYYSTLSKDETIKTEPINLEILAYNVIDSLQESIKKYRGEVLVNDLPTIHSSNAFLFTALKNLIENGLKYNKSQTPTVKISYEQTPNYHQIIISDNGIGIEPQYHEKIFEMFKRLHNRGVYEGSGIGLAIVKLVIEKLNGTVIVKSNENGSQFILQLPKI